MMLNHLQLTQRAAPLLAEYKLLTMPDLFVMLSCKPMHLSPICRQPCFLLYAI